MFWCRCRHETDCYLPVRSRQILVIWRPPPASLASSKAVLCLEHQQIPPHPLAPASRTQTIPFNELNLRLPDRLLPCAIRGGAGPGCRQFLWIRWYQRPCVIASQAPAAGGEASSIKLPTDALRFVCAPLLTLSARSEGALGSLAQAFADPAFLNSVADSSAIRDLCYLGECSRSSHHPHRLAVIVNSLEDLREKLSGYALRPAKHLAAAGAEGRPARLSRAAAGIRRVLGHGATMVGGWDAS